MAEFNPYKLEEEKWTPNNVYEILPPNAVSWSDYDFGQGTDNVDRDAAEKSFIDGFVDFFKDLFGVAGQILGGAIELGGAILGGFVEGVANFIGGIANAIGSIFGGGNSESPNPPLFNPIKTNLEAAIQPHRDKIDESWQKTEEILAEQEVLRGQMAVSLDEMRDARDRADEAIEKSGKSIEEAEAASAAAEDARQKLEDYNTALNERITAEFSTAVGRANTAVDKADSLAQQLADFKIQASADVEDALSKAQAANDELAALSPQIDEAVSNSSAAIDKADQTLADYTAWAKTQKTRIDSAVSKAEAATENVRNLTPQVADAVAQSAAATENVATLTPQVSEAVANASSAVSKADQTLSDYTAWAATQKTRIDSAVSKAEAATANVNSLTPQVADAVAKSTAATNNVATLTPQVTDAVTKAGAASDKADQTLADYTAWAKTQKTRIDSAVSKAEAATANVATLTPQVADAVAKSVTATDNVATLTPKVTDAVTKAGAAVTKADAVTSAYNTFKTEQQARIDSAVSKAEKASSDVSTLTPKVTDAVSKSNKAAADVSTLTPKVDDAAAKAAKASTDVSALSPRVDDAVAKANKATSDLSTLTPKVTAAQTRADNAFTEAGKVRDEVTPKINAAQTKGESALAVADKAVDWLRNPNEIGASLIAIDPETKKPNWAEHLVPVEAEENPLNLPNAYKTGEFSSRNPRRMAVNVDPSTEYMVSLWVKADKPGSQMTYDIRNQAGELAFDNRRTVDGFLDAGDNWRAFWIKNVPTEWTQYKKIVTPRETTRTAEFAITYFNHSSGTTRDAVQYIADFQIYPLVPSQLDVDQAQNDAIRANSEILRQQDEINEAQRVANLAQKNFNDNQTKWNTASTNATQALADAAKAQTDINAEQTKFNTFQTEFNKDQTKWNAAVDRSIATQKTVNDNFQKWTDGAAKAIEANTTAIKALTKPEIGSSLIALDADTREPHYLQWAGTPATPSTAGLPFTKAVRVNSSEQVRNDAPGDMRVPVKVNPDIVYKWSVWLYSNKVGTEIAFLTTSDSLGLCVEETTYKREDRVFTSKWGIFPKDIPTGWSKHEGTIKFLPGTDNVRLYAVEWNKTNVASTQQWFGAFDIVPDVPTQVQVDDAQNKAIESLNILSAKQEDWNAGTTAALEAQKKVNDNFDKWTTGATTAIEANTTAIKALSKIDIGESLIAYLTPTDAEVKAGTAKYDVPAWTTGAHKEYQPSSFTNPPPAYVKNIFGASSTDGTLAARKVPVTVRPGTKYILSFWAYGSGKIVIYLLGNGDGHPVKMTRQLMVDQTGLSVVKDAGGRRRYNPAANGNSSNANGTQWLLNGFKPDELYKWVHYKFEVEFTESTTEVWFQNFYWNWSEKSTYGQYLADMQFYPDVPTQADVDEAQNKAIEANAAFADNQKKWNDGVAAALETQKTVNDNFSKWTDGAATAIEANTKAIALLSAPQGASSLIPINPLTKEPNYLGWAGDRISVENIESVPTRAAVKYTGTAQKRFYASSDQLVPVKVARGQVYRWVAWTYANVADSSILIYFRDPATGTGTKATTHDVESKTIGHSSYGLFIRNIPSGWNKVSGTITFKDEISALEMYSIGWNYYGSSSSVTQYITGFDIAPDVPTQAQVDAAQNKAIETFDLFMGKQDEWNKGTTAALDAQKKVDDNLQKWTEGASTAIEANTRALAIINAGKQGSNIISVNPDSGRPWFAEPLKESTDHPPLTSGPTYYSPAAQTSVTTYGPYVEVDPKIKYTVSFWAKASKAGSVFYGQFRSQEGRTVTPQGEPLAKGAVTVANPPQPSNKDSNGNYVHDAAKNSYFVSNLKLNTTWTYYETEIQFNEGVTSVSIMRMYWSHTNGVKADQYISGLSIRPQIPTQAQVDDAQNKAIESLEILTAKQAEWSDGAEKAIQANTDVATALARINGIQVGGRNLLKKSYLNVSNNSYPTARADFGDSVPANGEEITISVKGSLGAGKTSFAFYNSGSSTQVASVPASERDSNGVYKVVTKWKSNSNNSYVNIYPMPSSATSTSTVEWIKLERGNQASDWTPAPEDLPTQKQVDDAQNDAISANTEALKALGKKSLGVSLVPYKTPSTKEVEDYGAGKLSYDPWAEPEYYNAGDRIGSTSRGRAPGSTVESTVNFQGTPVTVDAKIGYRVKFTTYAAVSGTRIFWYMYNQNNNNCLAETPFADTATTGGRGLIHGLTLPVGWKTWEGVVYFTPETEEVKLWTLFWNHPTGATGSQYIKDLSIVPEVPSQAAVDELQNNAIRKNTAVGSDNKAAIEALRDGLSASIELETVNELISGLEERIHQEEQARAKLQTKIDNLQNEMIPRTIIWESGREILDDYISMPTSNKIVALPGWTGQMVVTSVIRRGRGTEREPTYYQTSIDRYSVPTGTSREWTIYSGTSYEGISSMRVDYWVYRGKTRAINMANGGGYITGSSYVQGSERTIASYKVGKTYGTGQIEWRAQLKNANRGTTYRFIVRVTGQPDKTFTWSSVGPLTGLGSGLVTLKFDHEFNLPDNATVSIVAYTNASTSSRAIVNYSMGILTYVENTQ